MSNRLTQKVLASIAILGVTAGVATFGTYATFTDDETASLPVDTGIVSIALGAPGAANRLAVAAVDIVPGDTMQRAFTLNSTGSTDDLSTIKLTTTASTSSLLDTDATNGLQMVVEKCSIAWVEAGVSPAYTYTCLGTTTSIVASRAVIGSDINLAGLDSLTSGGSDNLRLRLTLPSTAGNTFQNKASTILYTFTGTQRAATDQ